MLFDTSCSSSLSQSSSPSLLSLSLSSSSSSPSSPSTFFFTKAAQTRANISAMQSAVNLSREPSLTFSKVSTFMSSSGDECDDLTIPLDSINNDLICNGCGFQIKEKHFMKVDDRCWHEHCLVCYRCRFTLHGSTCYTRDGQIYCKQDYNM
ncbi:unnamed protein product [Thelazia callipaeda]|uniref:LIM zinc-binding domain-containing protein n=1 Tax=Thelazia callipaeda TaxID=103827 RepID=A0A0N5CPY5_THECL|nr:unnamed protein product [Thelazia callipaeda]